MADNSAGQLQYRMSEPEETTLAWPPKPEDLRRLYVDKHLSAMKIAQRYGLKYPSPKTAESTILYQLKRAGITRRNCADHVRKVTEEMVGEWVRRYQAGESLKQIAGGTLSPVTVFYRLKKRGLILRDKVEANIKTNTKHTKNRFGGDERERSYLVGFVIGDCAVAPHGRAIRVRTATTHPAMAKLFGELFGRYGFVHRYPRKAKLTGYEWSLEVDLDSSFEFLLYSKKRRFPTLPKLESEFLAYLAGFFDAEGGSYLHRKRFGDAFEVYIASSEENLILPIHCRLLSLGYSSKVAKRVQSEHRLGSNNPGSMLQVRLWRATDVAGFARAVPSRHDEKMAKLAIVKNYLESGKVERLRLLESWTKLLDEIKLSRNSFVKEACEAVELKRSDSDIVKK